MTFLSQPFRTITATESVTGISTVFHTVDTTTTYLLACTNREIQKPEDMCGGGDGSQPLPAFSFEAPTPPPLGTTGERNVNKKAETLIILTFTNTGVFSRLTRDTIRILDINHVFNAHLPN